ncbi:MAG: 1-acyl-sn-glycerol-3-phosphate acyltransferase [Ruminococcaceae bacterium]|nr:1-acyl-sn-glycerol-3-phosphate acyltransferase [Oscillospiraceae bacterium]
MNSVKPSNRPSPSEKTKRGKPRLFHNFIYDFVYVTGAIPGLLWLRPKLHYPFGKPDKKGPLLVLANHHTLIDPILVQMAFPFRRLNSIATKDLFDTPAKARFFTWMHCIKIDKDNFAISSFHQIVDRLKEKKLVLIFPEGGVQLQGDNEIQAFKSGVVLMAHRSGAPVIPLYIAKKQKWYHRQHIVMGQAVDVKQLLGNIPTVDAIASVSKVLREKEIELRTYYENRG